MTNLEYAEGLRRLADILAINPRVVKPSEANTICISCFSAEEFAITVKAFGKGTKRDCGDTIEFVPVFPLLIKVLGHKRWMCEMRYATRIMPRQVIPALPAMMERIIEEHPETVIEYDCHPILEGLLANGEPEMATVADVAEALEATQ